MTLEQLRIFIAVAEREHVTHAAEAMNITQSAASSAIAALEARHGVALFHRIGRGIELTEAGRLFLGEARAVLAQASQAEQALADLAEMKRGSLRLVASQTIASYWLPPHLAAFHVRYPQITVELAIDNTDGAAKRVVDGSAELGFVEGAVEAATLTQWVIAKDRLTLVAATGAPRIDAAWVRAATWIVREQGSGTRSSFEEVLRVRGIDPSTLRIGMTLPSNEAVRTAVEAGAGVAVLSHLVVAQAIDAGRLIELPLDLPERSYRALRHKERYRSRAAEALTNLLKEPEK